MKIVFMGTPDFAVPCLERLIRNKYEVLGVFTQPDKKSGRGQKFTYPPVKEFALKNNLRVFQPVTLKDNEAYTAIKNLNSEAIVVVAYGKILPANILAIPKYGCINVHGSLLPKYRGAAPIQWAIINGEEKTGVTTMIMDEDLDTGDILLKAEAKIEKDDTSETLYTRLSNLGADLLIETLKKLEKGELFPQKQNEPDATYSKLLTKDIAEIDWNKPAGRIHNLVRGLIPWPIAYTKLNSKKLKIFKTNVLKGVSGEVGKIKSLDPFIVFCADDTALEILEVQFDNKKRMAAGDFFRGYRVKEQDMIIGK